MKITQTILVILLYSNLLGAQSEYELTHVEEMPYFAGCQEFANDVDAKRICSNTNLVQFVSRNLEYPTEARDAEIEGTVYVSFVIDETGKVVEPSILMDIGGGCGDAALAVLAKMPTWEPGIEEGKKTKVKLNLPIQFSLKNEEKTISENYNITWGHLNGTTISEMELHANINDGVNVWNARGDYALVKEITFIFERKKRIVQAKSREGVSNELKKIAKKAKAGGVFTIEVNIQEKGKFVTAKRSFEVVK